MISAINELSWDKAQELFEESGQSVALATIMHQAKVDLKKAKEAFVACDGQIRETIAKLTR